MILNFVTWKWQPEIFSIEKVSLSPNVLLAIAALFLAWGAIDYYLSNRKLKQWKADGADPKKKPDTDYWGAVIGFVMAMIVVIVRNKNPEGVEFGPVGVRWYGLMFLIGFIVGYRVVWRMFRHEGAPEAWMPTLLIYVAAATIIGARLGHCFFYEWDYYSANPSKIIAFWEGGLASHGGTIGIIIAILIYSKYVTHRSPIWTLDRLCVAVAFVACLIRLGNLFNSEIFGTATTLPWGFKYPMSYEWQMLYGASDAACHPTQLYEALTYLVLFGILMFMYWKRNAEERPGLLLGVFFIGVFLSRILIEFVKNPQEEFEKTMLLNMGQLLSVPFVLAGIWLIWRAMSRPRLKLDYPDKFPDAE